MTQKLDEPDEAAMHEYDRLLETANSYLSAGQYDLAQEYYNQAGIIASNQSRPYIGLGTVALTKNLTDEAEVAFEMATWLDSSSSEAYCGLAMVYQNKGNIKKAYRMYSKSLELNEENLTAVLGLFRISKKADSFGKVKHYLKLYLDSHPADTTIMFCLAVLYVRHNMYEMTEKILSKILVIQPNDKNLVNLLQEFSHRKTLTQSEQPVKI